MASRLKPAAELPAKIIHKILDAVGEDKLTLLCVAFLSRTWRDCSRYHIFRYLIFKDVRSLLQLARLYNSQHCSFPKTFQIVGSRLWIRENSFESVADQSLIYATLHSMYVNTLTIFVGKKAIPPWISFLMKKWTSITCLRVIGGEHPLSQFRDYLAPFPKLECIYLEGIGSNPFKADAEHYPVPATVPQLALNIRPRFSGVFPEGMINGGGLSKVVDLEIWTEARFVRNDNDLGWGTLTMMFRDGGLRHLERLTIHQLPQAYTDTGRWLDEDEIKSSGSTISLSHVDGLRTLTLDYSKADYDSIAGTLPGYMLALISARHIQTLEFILWSTIQSADELNDFLDDVDYAMNRFNPCIRDGEECTFEFIVRGECIDEKVLRDCLTTMAWHSDPKTYSWRDQKSRYRLQVPGPMESWDGRRLQVSYQ